MTFNHEEHKDKRERIAACFFVNFVRLVVKPFSAEKKARYYNPKTSAGILLIR